MRTGGVIEIEIRETREDDRDHWLGAWMVKLSNGKRWAYDVFAEKPTPTQLGMSIYHSLGKIQKPTK